MTADPLLIIQTACHHYAMRCRDIASMRLIADLAQLRAPGAFDRPCLDVELGPLLDPADQSAKRRHHALLVPLRRRYVAFLVDAVDTFVDAEAAEPLPRLLSEHLQQPWAIGVLRHNEQLVVLLDIIAIARSAVLSLPSATDIKGSTPYASGI